jgi:hypothetical protein
VKTKTKSSKEAKRASKSTGRFPFKSRITPREWLLPLRTY